MTTPDHPPTPSVSRFLAQEEVQRIAQRIIDAAHGGGETSVEVASWWRGGLHWARNRANLASDRRNIEVKVIRRIQEATGSAVTNQWDEASLVATVRAAERTATFQSTREVQPFPLTPPQLPIPQTQIWSDLTYNISAAQRGALAQTLTNAAEQQSLLSAGYLEMLAGEIAQQGTDTATPSVLNYHTYTQAQCSMTVRHPQGVGSGWAGLSSYDWSAIDSPALARRALDKCLASLNPVAIEPGRYTVILEPQAVSTIAALLLNALTWRLVPESGRGPFVLGRDDDLRLIRTKLDLKVVDDRLTISQDPTDPLLGIVPFAGLQPVTWIERGILTAISYDRTYALKKLTENFGAHYRSSYHMSGGTTTTDEMIQTTKRGLLVTRFSNLMMVDERSLLYTGVTRDGLWLIENGKISKAVKNLRFTESPLFVLNQVEQLGVPVPVFHPESQGVSPVIVPPLKANDFSFTATSDAI